jgi:hypothetical protein
MYYRIAPIYYYYYYDIMIMGEKIAAIELQLTGDDGPKFSLAIKAKSNKAALDHGQTARNRWSHIAGPRAHTSVRTQAWGR